MNRLPEIAPISDMRVRQAEIVEKAKRGPVVLVERGSRPALVVLSPEMWNEIAERLEFLEDAVAVYKQKWQVATGQDELTELSPATIAEWLGDAVPA
ncbi:MAG TPA: type II toxin-antitoxin system prevent-host-death family antitoxin [Caldilineaceae bacterium]|nr:type II toxin-antitoxin system prevent-host-death family antitoxin [Caldilineaceae bacterium]